MIYRPSARTFLFVWTLFLLVGTISSAEAARPFFEEEQEPRRFRLTRPAMRNPDAQLDYANDLRERGKLRKAQRQYRALVRYWPNTPQAARAQHAYAQVLRDRNKMMRAVDAYETLMEDYTGMIPHNAVLADAFDIGETLMKQRRGKFLFFPGFYAPERAIPIFEQVLEYGPQWERAPEAQLHIARIQEQNNRPEEALVAYERLESRYPRSPLAEEAAFGRGRALYELAMDYPNHVDGAELAMHTLANFMRTYPQSTHVEEARELLRVLYHHVARIQYEKARFYDRKARQPQAAVTTYERFLEQYPDTEWSDKARNRLAVLRATLGDDQ